MKKIVVFLMVLSLFVSLEAIAGKGSGEKKGKTSDTMSVEVREAVVKSAPNYMSSPVGKLTYGAEVTIKGEEENWYQIESPAGWLPKSSLTKHKVAVNPDQKMAGKNVSHDEVALAGKGFNPQVEAQYKKDNGDLAAAYVSVDHVEDLGATDGELKQFQAAGKLKAR